MEYFGEVTARCWLYFCCSFPEDFYQYLSFLDFFFPMENLQSFKRHSKYPEIQQLKEFLKRNKNSPENY